MLGGESEPVQRLMADNIFIQARVPRRVCAAFERLSACLEQQRLRTSDCELRLRTLVIARALEEITASLLADSSPWIIRCGMAAARAVRGKTAL